MSSPCPLPRLRHGEVTSDGDDDDYDDDGGVRAGTGWGTGTYRGRASCL